MFFIIDWLEKGIASLVENTSEEVLREEFKDLLENGEVKILTVAYA